MTILGWIDRSPRRHYFSLRPFVKDFDALILLKNDDLKKNDVGMHAIVRVSLQRAKGNTYEGTIVEAFSSMDDRELELSIIQESHGFPLEFAEATLQDAEAVRSLKPGQRVDLTSDVTVTIDGETAKDFDDAIAVKKLSNGNFNIKVSIADVSHYVLPGSALDQEAFERGTSIYFPGFCVPMLPERLSNDLCSLVPHQDRLTLTCEMEVSPSCEIVESSIYPSVINSKARLTYTTVSKVIEKGEKGLVDENIEKMLHTAFELSKIVRKERFDRGALDLDMPEMEIEVNEAGEVVRTYIAVRNEAHRLIEDFMILANECVSESIEEKGFPAIFRVHEDPDPIKIEALQVMVKRWGFTISQKENLVDSLQNYLDSVRGHQDEKILVVSLLRSLKQAQYSASNVGHFGLGSESYCHFTSPIRRYPDLMVHRILRNSDFLKSKEAPYDHETLSEISTRCSETERRAFLAERDMEDMKKARFLEDKVGQTFEGIITSVKNFGMFVEILPFMVDGMIPVRELPPDFWEVDELNTCIRGRRTRKEFWLGDRVQVQISSVNRLERRVALRFVEFSKNHNRTGKSNDLEFTSHREKWNPKKYFDKSERPNDRDRGGRNRQDQSRGPRHGDKKPESAARADDKKIRFKVSGSNAPTSGKSRRDRDSRSDRGPQQGGQRGGGFGGRPQGGNDRGGGGGHRKGGGGRGRR